MTNIVLKEARQLAMYVGGYHKEVMDALINRLEKWESVFGHLGEPDEVGNEWHVLSDRLEAAESEAIEQARLNGMGAERELALMAKLEVVEKERDALRTVLTDLLNDLEERAKWNLEESQRVVACGNGVYMRAKAALEETK